MAAWAAACAGRWGCAFAAEALAFAAALGAQLSPDVAAALTPFAEGLHPQIQLALRGVERAITTPTAFDPTTSTRRFRIVSSDYIMVAVLVPLIERFAVTAPGVRVEIIQPTELKA